MANRNPSWGQGGHDRFSEDDRYGPPSRGRRSQADAGRPGSRERAGEDERETWRRGRGEPYGDLELNARNRGVEEDGPPHDYAYHPQAGHEFDPDYLHWRDQQMRGHDRDYEDWRRHQQQSYDEDYRKFRHHRRDTFGRTFEQWRAEHGAVGGTPDLTAAPGVSGYGDKTAAPGGYSPAGSRPSGFQEPMNALNASPGAGQSGGNQSGGQPSGGDTGRTGQADADRGAANASPETGSPEFGRAPAQVQAAAQGWDGRGAAADHVARNEERDRTEH